MGKLKKKGKVGIATKYITRTRAVRKLQITLKDFRRLCILKGIYPRAPKKVNQGRDKTYYHLKDIKFLQYEPVLDKFRQIKTFMKKFNKLLSRGETYDAKKMEKKRPKVVVDHLIKERYPQFTDALGDIDDPLSMVYLFAGLPSKLTHDHTAERVSLCLRLCREWEIITSRSRVLEKVFVSLKGMYYQAVVQGQAITWLVPHQFKQHLPDDVDYRVMLTFLQFYETMVKFVNFKLFHDAGLHYPPVLDEAKEAERAGLSARQVTTLDQHRNQLRHLEGQASSSSSSSAPSVTTAAQTQELQRRVAAVIKQLPEQGTELPAVSVVDPDAVGVDDFSTLDPLAPSPNVSELPNNFFAGLKFLLCREVPHDSLEYVILCGGGQVVLEKSGVRAAQFDSDGAITHVVSDRPNGSTQGANRDVVQPQWVFDSFNAKSLLPVLPYAPGVTPPPHLSPFVDYTGEDVYIPDQKLVLDKWVRQARGIAAASSGTTQDDSGASDSEEKDDEELEQTQALEAQYTRGLVNEHTGTRYSEQQSATADDDDEEDEQQAESSSSSEVEEEPVTIPLTKKQKRKQQETEMAAMMMTSKKTRLYNRVKGFQDKKAAENAKLSKRKAAAQQTGAGSKRKKSKTARQA